ncbi:MAG: hypothetical protein J4F38_12830 [Pseudomonadales bacterium]|nr:hypothetical protein [Pseudomonadales bacterium]
MADKTPRAHEMFLGKKLASAGAIDYHVYRREERHDEAVLSFLSRRADVPNMRIRLESRRDAGADPAGSKQIAVDELDAWGCDPDQLEGIARLVAPLDVTDFYSKQYRQPRPLVFRGRDDRFAGLISWDDLNDAICNRNLRPPQLHVVMDGVEVADDLFQVDNLGLGTRQPGPFVSRVDARKLANFLRSGATFIANSIHDYHEPIRRLSDEIERSLATYANVNLYASWRSTRGFATHWDDHDVYIIQAVGEKEWHLFGETRNLPTTLDNRPNLDRPDEPVWSGKLTAGDVLYVPRGWWHDARVDEADDGKGSIHLTLNTRPITGTWVLRWLENKLLDHEVFRMNTPLAADAASREDYFRRLVELIREELSDDLGDRFESDIRASWTEATRTSLSTYIEPWKSPLWDSFQLSLKGRRHAAIETYPAKGSFVLRANGIVRKFDLRCLDLIRALAGSESLSVEELKGTCRDRFPGEFVDGFVKQLIKDDAVSAFCPSARAP